MNNNLVETAQEVLRGTRYYQAEAANGDATEENFELDYILVNLTPLNCKQFSGGFSSP